MAGNTVKLTFAGDSKSLERSLDAVGDGAKDMADDLTDAGKEAGRFSGAVGGMNDKIGASESKFMGAADLADGLASTLGINVGPTIEYARGFADMAGGFTNLVGPAMENLSGKIGKMTAVTKIQTVAQQGLNAVMRANPIGIIITALAALAIGFTIAYKKSETFRNVVHSIKDAVIDAGKKLAGLADLITTPYQIAFRTIARLWNSTIGKLEVNIPGFLGFGGISFDVPDIPTFHRGGVVPGAGESLARVMGGETIRTPAQEAAIGGVTVVIATGASDLDELIRKRVKLLGGGNVQLAYGGP